MTFLEGRDIKVSLNGVEFAHVEKINYTDRPLKGRAKQAAKYAFTVTVPVRGTYDEVIGVLWRQVAGGRWPEAVPPRARRTCVAGSAGSKGEARSAEEESCRISGGSMS